ncbi:MAG: hypothetical protein BWZ02_00298 [Lentisphaerae bacterium ADurb.BinA184]|nr:MAG: hypothetical protein BWZ02_00298 [Lentisphaerae bacterium ADurb.BinA184]
MTLSHRCLPGLLLVAASLSCVAAERTLTLRDWTGRGFAPDAVTYSVDGAKAKNLRVFDAAGQAVAVQVAEPAKGEALLTFVTDLAPGATAAFTVRDDGKGDALATAVAAQKDGDALVLTNGLLAVKVPATQEKTYKEPVAASVLPAPVLAFRGADGAWRGAGRMLTTRPAKSFAVEVTAKGPVFCEVRYAIEFAAGGFYRATVRVEDRVPLAKISEEYDPGVMWGETRTSNAERSTPNVEGTVGEGGTSGQGYGDDVWDLNLAAGWQPDRMEIASTQGNGQVDAGHVEPLENLTKKPSWYVVPDNAWGPLSQLGLFADSAKQATPGAYPMAGIVPLHKGDWRHMNGIEIQSTGAQDVRARFPMSRRNASWLREVTSETSPFSMQEHEPGVAHTYGRRHWGLVLAAPARTCKAEADRECGPFYQARLFYGVVGLDRYKDFITEWPDTGAKYPRLYLKADQLDAYKRHLEAAGLPDEFRQKLTGGTLSLGADPAGAAKRVTDVTKRLDYIIAAVFASPTTGHHWTAPQYMTAAAADDVLGWPGLPAETRAALRSRIALICHLWQDPDILGFGGGSHTGNPNMGTARFAPMVAFLPLVPDHPMAEKWRAHMAAYVGHKAAIQTAPGGGYFEYGAAYHMHGYSRVMNAIPALQAAGATGLDHLLDIDRANWAYYMNLLTPLDSRWKFRVIPGMANSPPGYTEHLLEAAGELAGRDPELAANLAWAWNANGANGLSSPVGGMNGQLGGMAPAPKEPALHSMIYPGVGVIFRAHQGPDETYLFLRSGNNWSHWNEDQGHMIFMSRGATLLPFQPYQYWGVKNAEFDDHNLVRFGHPENKMPHAWVDSNILDHAFGERVDYAWSSTGFPDWYIQPGATAEWRGDLRSAAGNGIVRKLDGAVAEKQSAFEWNRQILFLKGKTGKSPNYFVVRDSTPGDGKLASWLYLNLLGTKDGVKAEGGNLFVDTEWPVKLDVRFPQVQSVKPDFYEERQFVSLGGYSGPSWWRTETLISRNWVKADGTPVPPEAAKTTNPGFHEQHTMVRLPAAPGEGYFWLLYPRTADEPAPTVSAPAPGVMEIDHPEGTDYAFLASAPFAYAADGVVFTGCAGAVRVAKDGTVTLALTGGRGKVGYKGTIVSGTAPFEKTFAAVELKAGELAIPGAPSATSLTLPAADLTDVAPGVRLSEADGKVLCHVDAAPAGGRVVGTFGKGIGVDAQGRAFITADGRTVRFIVVEPVYAKLSVGNVGVRGCGPFDLTFAADKISGTVEGVTRTIATTFPAQIVRPMYHLDGHRWYAGWADDHSIVKGTPTPQFGLAFGVTDGKHTVEICEWAHPALPATPARARIGF